MNNLAAVRQQTFPTSRQVVTQPLGEHELEEALAFLSARPLQTVIMAGWLRERGVKSPTHRGEFYGCRDAAGELSGVGLAGRNTFFEARSYEAVRAFAEVAKGRSDVRMVFAEVDKFFEFWHAYSGSTGVPLLATTELLFETRDPLTADEPVSELRPATSADLEQVSIAHAEMVFAETGADPFSSDRQGFLRRCAARIGERRVWVWMRDGELLFKSDIVSETPEVVYLEGIWVNQSVRGRGYGRRALATLCSRLLNGSNAICGFVNSADSKAQALYWKTGFNLCGRYKKLYL